MAPWRGTTLPLRSHRNQPKCQENQCSRRETPAVSVQVEFDGIPEAAPAATAQDHPSLHRRERSSLLKNRMREICTSGSVRGGDGNIPAYSAQHGVGPPVMRLISPGRL